MTGYIGGRKNGVNVSQYIANLNKEPSAVEVAKSDEQNFTVDDASLAQFTNAEFLDFDAGDFLSDTNGVPGGLGFDDGSEAAKNEPAIESTRNGLDFVNGKFVSPFILSPRWRWKRWMM